MKIKATNPYSEKDTSRWTGWEAGFHSSPNAEPPQAQVALLGLDFLKAFYRGQGAQVVKKYK